MLDLAPGGDALLDLVVCPQCKSTLSGFDECDGCGTGFVPSDTRPSLIPDSATAVFPYMFTSKRSVAGPAFQEALRYPPLPTAASDLPYHLDAAHAKVLDELPSGSSVLDVGCGGGQMREHLTRRGIKYMGVDITAGERVGEELRVHGGPDLLCDAHFLPFPDDQFDVVYSAGCVEHLACPHRVAQEVRRVLKPGGQYMGSVSFLEPWHDDSFFHMTPLGVFEMLAQADLVPEYIWPGRGYTGFNAIMILGNKATVKARFLGKLNSAIYRAGYRIRNVVRPRPDGTLIMDEARVSGSTDWIARKPALA